MNWRMIWELRLVWWAKLTAFAGLVYAVYAGREKFMSTWRYWWFEHYDRVIWETLKKRPKGHYGRGFRLDELANETGRTEKAIKGSLNRLLKDKGAIETPKGWYGDSR